MCSTLTLLVLAFVAVEVLVLIIIHLDEGTALQRLSADVQSLHTEVTKSMTATKGQFDTLIAMFNTETNSLAARLDALKTQLAAALANGDRGLSVTDAQAVFDELTNVSNRLTALAADPANPLPVADPLPPDDNPPVPATAG